jgi:hypothetical protein
MLMNGKLAGAGRPGERSHGAWSVVVWLRVAPFLAQKNDTFFSQTEGNLLTKFSIFYKGISRNF